MECIYGRNLLWTEGNNYLLKSAQYILEAQNHWKTNMAIEMCFVRRMAIKGCLCYWQTCLNPALPHLHTIEVQIKGRMIEVSQMLFLCVLQHLPSPQELFSRHAYFLFWSLAKEKSGGRGDGTHGRETSHRGRNGLAASHPQDPFALQLSPPPCLPLCIQLRQTPTEVTYSLRDKSEYQ